MSVALSASRGPTSREAGVWPVIECEGLSRAFGGRLALDRVTLQVPAGQIFGLMGPNGAGKTTMVRLLLGLLEPSAGRATVLGFDASSEGDDIRARTGSLLEHTGLYERLTADDNLEFQARVHRLPRAERRARIDALLDRFGLRDRRSEVIAGWSRGMKQKLALARAMLHRPALLLLDEPTDGLDPVAAADLRDDLAALVAREGVTVFLTTHNVAEAEALCSRIVVLRQGVVAACGRPDELRRGHVTLEAAMLDLMRGGR